MAAQVGALRIAIGADISPLIEGMNRAQGVVKRGADGLAKSAKASAKVFEDARRQADSLLGSIDPLHAAQVRYDRELAKAQQLMKAGVLTTGEMARVQAGLKNQLDSVAKSYGNVAGASTRTRAGFTQLSFQIGDISQGLALGTKASTIFAQQSGQVIQSLQIMGGQGSAFLRFLGGPWGIALSTAAVVLTPFIGKLFDARDEIGKLVDKMREQAKQAALNEQADAAWKRTIEGLTDAIRNRRKEQEKQLQTDIQAEQESLKQARGELATAKTKQQQVAQQLRDALAKLATAKEAPVGFDEEAERSRDIAIERASDKVRKLTAQLATLNKDVADAEANIRGAQATISERAVDARIDQVAAATDDYTKTLGDLRGALQAGSISQKEFEDRLEAAKRKLEAVKEAAKEAGKETAKAAVAAFKSSVIGAEGTGPNRLGSSASGFGQFMPRTWLSYFNRLFPDKSDLSDAAKLAFRDVRSVATAVIDKATDDYVKVLKAAGAGITAANLYTVHLLGAKDARKLLSAAAGADTSSFLSAQVLKGNPFLRGSAGGARAAIAKRIGDSSGPVSAATAAIDKELEDQKKRELIQENDFAAAKDRLNKQILQAQGVLAKGIEAQAAKAIAEALEDERRQDAAIDADLAEGKYGDATSELAKGRAEQLKVLNHSLALEQIANANIEKKRALDEAAFRLRDEQMSLEIEALRDLDKNATTAKDHRQAQLDILDAVYAQKAFELDHERQLAERNGASDDEIAAIQAKIDALAGQKERDRVGVRNGTRGPLDEWAASVPQTADEINEALQRIQVEGLEGLTDALTDLITGTKSLKEAFREMAASIIADTIRMIIKMLIFRAISSAFGLGGGGGFSGDSLGGGQASAAAGLDSGGSIMIGGHSGIDRNVLSLNGLPIARVSKGESLDISSGSDGPGSTAPAVSLTNYNDFRGADPAAMAAIMARQDRFEKELPARVVNAWNDARTRFVIR